MSSNDVRLSAAIATYGHTRLLKSKQVEPVGFDMRYVEVEPIIAAFRRMIRTLEFDVCELAPTTYLMAREAGVPITALPIFLMRRFHHGDIVCRPGSGIVEPKDLEGRKVGVRAYTVSTGVWARGILHTEYGVDPDSISWIVDDEEHLTSYRLPPNVEQVGPGQSIAHLFDDGGIDAALSGPAGIGRSGAPGAGWAIAGAGFDEARERSESRYPLFADAAALERSWYERTSIYPIHGLVVVKDEILRSHPDLAAALLDAFSQSKNELLDRLADTAEDDKELAKFRELSAIVGDDPLPYGIESNEASIEALVDYSASQHITRSRPAAAEIFAV
jgi:4,5-dihydroxyphthalate decarboxylase